MGLRRYLRHRCTDHQPIDLPAADVYELLAVQRRRQALLHLDGQADGELHHGELARLIAGDGVDTPASAVADDVYQRAYVALYQSHLPVMHRHEVVDWTRDGGLVKAGPSVPGLAALVREVDARTS